MSVFRIIRRIIITTLSFFLCNILFSQPVPGDDENIPYLMTFGPKAEKSWGDDDFSQTFFFLIPENYKDPVFIKVFDPEVGGVIDEMNGTFDTQMMYSVYGGKDTYSNPDAKGTDPVGNYKSGNLLATKTFGVNPKYDNNWYTFGPFNPTEGEYAAELGGYVFKIICDGINGNDGNMYRYYLSTTSSMNKAIEGAYAFAYEYSFRMHDEQKEVSHIYPFVDNRTVTLKQMNFDWDKDGFIRVVSVARKGQMCAVSNQDEWVSSEFRILDEEKNTSLDFQFIKANPSIKNNNVVINVRNQYGELLQFNTIPIGGVPKFKFGGIDVKKKQNN